MRSHINSRDLPKPVGRTATISLSFSKYSKLFTWSGFKQNDRKLRRLKAYPSRLNTDSSPPSWFFHFEYANLANLLHPGFQGVRWTCDQPMSGPFPAPSTFKGKALGTRLMKEISHLLTHSLRILSKLSIGPDWICWLFYSKNLCEKKIRIKGIFHF